ncbi:MAG TPA: hypothetical protein VGM23_06580 [Armatimonadota bacterium]
MRIAHLFLLPLLALPLLGRAAPGPNLLTNSSFEDGVAGWTAAITDPQKAGAAADIDTRGALEGGKSAKCILPAQGSITLRSGQTPVEAGRDYLLSGWFHGQGFSKDSAPGAVNAILYLNWYSADKKSLGRAALGLSHLATPAWALRERLATAPLGAAFADVSLDFFYRPNGQPSTLWLDRIQLRRWDVTPLPNGKTWVFEAARGFFTRAAFRRTADDEADSGFSVYANARFATQKTYLVGGMYCKELKPGAYRVSYRVRIGEKPAESKLLLAWDNNTPVGYLNNGAIYTGDFTQANQYQLFTDHFIVPPGLDWVDFRAAWQADIPTWIDTVTVTEEEKYTDEQIMQLFK